MGSDELALEVAVEHGVGLALIDDETVFHHDHTVGEAAHRFDVVSPAEAPDVFLKKLVTHPSDACDLRLGRN